jgi:DNA-binding NtrC family response regulator
MGRREGPKEGYVLLDKLRGRGNRCPFIIYAASRKAEHFDESVRRGALGCTNRPKELMQMALSALRASTTAAG